MVEQSTGPRHWAARLGVRRLGSYGFYYQCFVCACFLWCCDVNSLVFPLSVSSLHGNSFVSLPFLWQLTVGLSVMCSLLCVCVCVTNLEHNTQLDTHSAKRLTACKPLTANLKSSSDLNLESRLVNSGSSVNVFLPWYNRDNRLVYLASGLARYSTRGYLYIT